SSLRLTSGWVRDESRCNRCPVWCWIWTSCSRCELPKKPRPTRPERAGVRVSAPPLHSNHIAARRTREVAALAEAEVGALGVVNVCEIADRRRQAPALAERPRPAQMRKVMARVPKGVSGVGVVAALV